MIYKNPDGVTPDPAFVEAEIGQFNVAVDSFALAMKIRFADKAREGWYGWDSLNARETIYTNLLAHAAGVPLAAGEEVDVANLAMMLWRLRVGAPGGE